MAVETRKIYEIKYKCKDQYKISVPYIFAEQIFTTNVLATNENDAKAHFEQFYPCTYPLSIKQVN